MRDADGEALAPGFASACTTDAGGPGAALARKRDRLKQLRAFCETARCGSISGAGKALGLTQPAVSLQVRTLEEELGMALLDRRGPRIALTTVGVRLYESAMPVVQGLMQLPAAFAETHHGEGPRVLRIGAGSVSASYLLPGPLMRFAARHPGLHIEVRIGTGRERLEWLRTFELDATVGVFDASTPGLECRPFHVSTMVLVTPPDHPLADRGPLAPAALAGHALVAPRAEQAARVIQDTLLHVHGVTPRVLVEVNGWQAIVNHVAAGAGIAFVPDLCVAGSERVCVVEVKTLPLRRIYAIAVPRHAPASPATRRFVEMLASDPQPGAEGAR